MQLLSITKHLKTCLKMFLISKQNVAIRMQVKHLLNVNSLEIIWSSFLLIIMNQLLRKSVLVRKSLFHLFWNWFLTLSFLHRKLPIQICFCKVAGENGKNFPMDVFIIFQLSRSVRLHRKWFSSENKEKKTTLLQETQADQTS